MKHLIGHTSPETAFVVEDYPYGFRLRCKIRYWLEYKKGFGYRLVSQTTNPKLSSEVWNKPKASTYAPLAVMVQLPPNDKGHCEVSWVGFSFYDLDKFEAFVTEHSEALQDDTAQSIIKGVWAAIARRAAAKVAV